MPRRSPGAVRAQTRLSRGQSRQFSQIRGLRRSGQAAVRLLEARRFWPGYLSEALGQYERFLRQPGRWLYVPLADCPCHDVLGGRDNLQTMLDVLPSGARGELRQIVARLDEEFERRTLPNPYASPGTRNTWWYRRLTGP